MEAARQVRRRARQRLTREQALHYQAQQLRRQHLADLRLADEPDSLSVAEFAEHIFGVQVRSGMSRKALGQLHEFYYKRNGKRLFAKAFLRLALTFLCSRP
jgi:GAF domain-containing protein